MTEARQRLGRMGPRVADVQRFGLLSAAAVVDRYVDLVDRALGPPLTGGGSTAADAVAAGPDLRLLAEATTRMAEAYVSTLDAATRLLPRPATAGAGPLRGGEGAGHVALPDTLAGGTAEATLWLHNPTAQAVDDVVLAATALVAGAGAAVGLTVEPARLEVLPAATSVPVRLCADVPLGHPPAVCWGLVVCSADPQAPVGVTLRVVPPAEAPA